MIFVEQCYISTTENKNKSLLFFSRFLFFGAMLIFSAFFCQDFWKIWVVWTHTEMLQTKTCKNMLFFNEVFGCHAFFVIFFCFFVQKKWQHVKKTCKNHVLKPSRICEVMCGCFLPVFQHLCLALTYVKQFFLVSLENHVNQTMNQRWAQLAMIFGKPELSCIFDGLVVFKLARAQKTQ